MPIILAQAEPPPAAVAQVQGPSWARLPPPESFQRYYPKGAWAKGLEGRAVIDCAVAATGRLDACQVTEEAPTGEGFGEAALNLAPLFEMKPLSKSGQPTAGAHVRLPIRFVLPAAPAASATGLVTDPQWEPLKPGASADLMKMYPKAALEHGVDGTAVVECHVAASGELEACQVSAEEPSDQRFGPAAIAISTAFRMKPLTLSGAPPVGRPVRLSIRFRMPWSKPVAGGERPAFTVVGYPQWIKKPRGEDIARVYPIPAQQADVEGRGTLQCRVQSNGSLTDCKITEGAPAEYHFGEASLKLAPLFQMDMTKGSGLAASGQDIEIPIRYQLPRG